MTNDLNIRNQIEEAIGSNTYLQGSNISVDVENGHAVLGGHVDKFRKKEIARKVAKDVEGVAAVTETIAVELSEQDKVGDDELAGAIAEKFRKNFGNAYSEIKTIVKDGNVWLEGHLKWKYQKDLAEECIADIAGIKWIGNEITVPEALHPAIDEKDVLAAIYGDRSITTDIRVEIAGRRIILRGYVENVNQKNLIARLVRSVPNVEYIENFLTVD